MQRKLAGQRIAEGAQVGHFLLVFDVPHRASHVPSLLEELRGEPTPNSEHMEINMLLEYVDMDRLCLSKRIGYLCTYNLSYAGRTCLTNSVAMNLKEPNNGQGLAITALRKNQS